MHYELYKTRCDVGNIVLNNWAIPRALWKEMQENKARPGTMKQSNLDGQFALLSAPNVFTREGVLHAVAQHIVCDDQVGKS
jgi:hypothetical protein